MAKVLLITNIPTPYRQKTFSTMARIFPSHDIELEVLYMARTEPDRQWVIPEESYQYPFRFFLGIHPAIGGLFAHFNPGLLLRLLKKDYQLAIIGGMASPTHWLAPFFISRKKKKIMWLESNLLSVRREKGVGARIKSILLNKMDAYQIPGEAQIDYIKYFLPRSIDRPVIMLPNLIDEEKFTEKVDSLRKEKNSLRAGIGVAENEQMWIMPARLMEKKGILPFLDLIKEKTGFRLYIIGDGDQENAIRFYVANKNYPVILTGFMQQDEILKYYAAADLFVLPSLRDPSPLSPIEACAAGLPLLVSSRIGNLAEVLEPDKNGWCYDPVDEVLRGNQIADNLLIMPRSKLADYGRFSRLIFEKNFNAENVIKNYAERLVELLTE